MRVVHHDLGRAARVAAATDDNSTLLLCILERTLRARQLVTKSLNLTRGCDTIGNQNRREIPDSRVNEMHTPKDRTGQLGI